MNLNICTDIKVYKIKYSFLLNDTVYLKIIIYICHLNANVYKMPKIIVQKEDWIKLGYQLFAQNGMKGIVIEKMAKKLKVNKSSFYWYFKTKASFIDEIVGFWIQNETEQVINYTDKGKSIKEKISNFLTIAFKNDPYLEFIFYLKKYAIQEKKYQQIIDSIDERRLKYTTNLFQELGYSKKEATIKASIFYKYLIGYHEMIRHKKQNKNYLNEVIKELNHFINI